MHQIIAGSLLESLYRQQCFLKWWSFDYNVKAEAFTENPWRKFCGPSSMAYNSVPKAEDNDKERVEQLCETELDMKPVIKTCKPLDKSIPSKCDRCYYSSHCSTSLRCDFMCLKSYKIRQQLPVPLPVPSLPPSRRSPHLSLDCPGLLCLRPCCRPSCICVTQLTLVPAYRFSNRQVTSH